MKYKQGYGNNEHVATAWLLSVELKCWFLAQLVELGAVLVNSRIALLSLTYGVLVFLTEALLS